MIHLQTAQPYSAKLDHQKRPTLGLGSLYTITLETSSGPVPIGISFGRGPKGQDAVPSTDPGNQVTLGEDGGLYMGDPALATAQW